MEADEKGSILERLEGLLREERLGHITTAEVLDGLLKEAPLNHITFPSRRSLEGALSVIRKMAKADIPERVVFVCDGGEFCFDVFDKDVKLIIRNSGVGVVLLANGTKIPLHKSDIPTQEELLKMFPKECLTISAMPTMMAESGIDKVPHHKRGFINKKGPQGRKPWQ